MLGRPVRRTWVIGVAVAVAGIVALSTGGPDTTRPAGWAFAVAAGCCYPVYGLAAQQLMADRPPLGAIATVFGAGAVLTVPLCLTAGTIGSSAGSSAGAGAGTAATITLVLYLGLAATALAYALWAIGLHRLSLSDTVAVTLAEPAAAVVLAAVALGEPLSLRSITSMVVVVGGVAIATLVPTRPSAAAQ